MFDRIDANESYSPQFRERMKSAYTFFKSHGYTFTEHGLIRAVNPKTGKGKRQYTLEDILDILKRTANFSEGETRVIKYYDGIAIIQAVDSDKVISIVSTSKPKGAWKGLK